MKSRPRFLASVAASLLATGALAFLAIVSIQQKVNANDPAKAAGDKVQKTHSRPAAKPEPPFSFMPSPEALRPPIPDPATVYEVSPIPIRGRVEPRTPEQDRAVQAASTILSKLRPIPQDRIRFFAWMNEANSPVAFAGWNVFIQQSVATPKGRLITARVSAMARAKRDGSPIGVNNNFIEEYLWYNGKLLYVKGYCCPIIGPTPYISSM